MEYRLISADGTAIWGRDQTVAVRDEEYRPLFLQGYLSDITDRREQLKFAIAAYNGGAGHIADARRLARKLKLDPGRWEGNVEEAVKFLKFRSFHKFSRYGYCNGTLVANYTNSVLALAERFRNE
jgi:membrane-bound lytic murein transglycosylase F